MVAALGLVQEGLPLLRRGPAGGEHLVDHTRACGAVEAHEPSYRAGRRGGAGQLYLWHEFGDVPLILPEENAHPERCSGNSW